MRLLFWKNDVQSCHLLLMVVWIFLSGCKSFTPTTRSNKPLIWPSPPATTRIIYEKSISRPADLGIRKGWLKSVVGFIVGNGRNEPAFIKPTGVCIDQLGNLCVTDTGNSSVWFFDLQHQRYKHWYNVDEVLFYSPVSIAKYKDTFYVADSGLGAIIVFSMNGKFLFKITDGIERPSGLSIEGQTLWVTDSKTHRITAFDLQGQKLREFGTRGKGAGEFNFPTHVSCGYNDSLYVTDSLNFRIQKVNKQGKPLQSIGTQGNASGSFSRPKGVATDSQGNIYVVDALFENIQIFNPQGQFLMCWGENGSGPGCFWLPSDIVIDTQDRIWVADSYNRRIQVFKRVNHHEEN